MKKTKKIKQKMQVLEDVISDAYINLTDYNVSKSQAIGNAIETLIPFVNKNTLREEDKRNG